MPHRAAWMWCCAPIKLAPIHTNQPPLAVAFFCPLVAIVPDAAGLHRQMWLP